VATNGWLEVSDRTATAVASQFREMPLAAVIYTDIGTDGMLGGPNLDAICQMREAFEGPVVASGGIRSAKDIQQLAEIPVTGCIVGKAFYEGRLSMTEALAAATGS
jgi:phosphoribosylformimino-5-aminoimidazole carboxamide ribotide isomerase